MNFRSPNFFLAFLCLFLVLGHAQNLCFEDYVAKFNKTYSSSEEYQSHKSVYQRNCEEIRTYNQQNSSSKVAINQFTDLTEEQLNQFRTARADMFTGTPTKVITSQLGAKVGGPTSVDWRVNGSVTSVKDQGLCGACWVFSSAAYLESLMLMLYNQAFDLSEQFLLECTNTRSNCTGGYVDDALSKAINLPVPLQSSFGYTSYYTQYIKPSGTRNICSNLSSSVPTPPNSTVEVSYSLTDTQMRYLIDKSPIVALIYADTNFMRYSSGVFQCNQTYSGVNHAVQIIGYTQDGDYIIKNSWGTAWGTAGFGIVSKSGDCNLKQYIYRLNTPSIDRPVTNYQMQTNKYLVILFLLVLIWF